MYCYISKISVKCINLLNYIFFIYLYKLKENKIYFGNNIYIK